MGRFGPVRRDGTDDGGKLGVSAALLLVALPATSCSLEEKSGAKIRKGGGKLELLKRAMARN